MADQTITVTIPAGQTVIAALGIIMTVEGRVVAENKTSPIVNDPKIQLMMLEQARNEIGKTPANLALVTAARGLRRS